MCGQVFVSLWTSVSWSVNRLDLRDSRQLIASVNNLTNHLVKLENSFIWGKHWKAIHVLGQVFHLFMCLCKCVGVGGGGCFVFVVLCFGLAPSKPWLQGVNKTDQILIINSWISSAPETKVPWDEMFPPVLKKNIRSPNDHSKQSFHSRR